MITIFQGTLGSGKSASMVVDLIEHLLSGGVCAANFRLVDGWAVKLAAYNWKVRLGIADKYKVAQDYYDRFRLVGSVDSLWQASEELIPLAKGRAAEGFEGHGRFYLDECQNYFNAREWQANKGFIHFFSQSRKLKWDGILVAHDISMIDKQIRPFIELEARFRNLQRVKVPVLGIPLSPVPAFLAITRYAGRAAGAGQVFSRRVYPLFRHYADLYDSALIFADDIKIDAPLSCGPAPTRKKGAAHRKGAVNRIPDPSLAPFFDEMAHKWGFQAKPR